MATEAAWLTGKQFGEKIKKRKENNKNERKALTLTGLLMEGVMSVVPWSSQGFLLSSPMFHRRLRSSGSTVGTNSWFIQGMLVVFMVHPSAELYHSRRSCTRILRGCTLNCYLTLWPGLLRTKRAPIAILEEQQPMPGLQVFNFRSSRATTHYSVW